MGFQLIADVSETGWPALLLQTPAILGERPELPFRYTPDGAVERRVGSRIGTSPIFRLATTGVQWDFILSEEIVETIRSSGLTGLTLEEVVVK